ncbi:MAG TPA: hypothetical protein VGI39_21490 [Polyangiaceae bacterium]|jgi:hypothetical protein
MTSPSSESRLASFLERLYAAPLDGFVATRKVLAGELRALGATGEAKELAAVRKPPPSAWALDQLARHRPEELRSFFAASDRVRDAQAKAVKQRDPAALREAVRTFRASVAEVAALAVRELASAGGASAAHQRAIAATLQAVPFASPEEIEALGRGVLGKDLEPSSDFAIFGLVPSPPDEGKPAEEERAKGASEAQTQRHREEAETRARRHREEAEARRIAEEAERRAREAARLAKIADQAEEEANRLEEAAAKAAARARTLEAEAREARLKATRAREAARTAE